MKAATRALSANGYDVGFQSTPPVKAATDTPTDTPADDTISIHAAREGGDLLQKLFVPDGQISIHAAREGGDHILSTFFWTKIISIHAAREGGDII